tara:strand:+ start:548 stop:730 length:183 start_codon:yes stop_codon:yes gene_type:complete
MSRLDKGGQKVKGLEDHAEQFVTALTMDSAPAMESPFQGELNSTAVLEPLVKPEMLVGAV